MFVFSHENTFQLSPFANKMTTYFVYKYLTVLNKNTAPYINAVNDHHHHQQQKQEQHQSGDVKVSMPFASR